MPNFATELAGRKNYKRAIVRAGALWLLVSLCYACNALLDEERVEPVADMSPKAVVAENSPWHRAQEIARHVPNSDVMVGHGDAMLPIYPNGTVMVVQRVELANLRPGMTVIFLSKLGDPYSMSAQLLTKQYRDDSWLITGLDKASRRYRGHLDEDNYVGVVVAALKRVHPEFEQNMVMPFPSPYCTLQCHIEGEVHPRIIPGVQSTPLSGPKPGV